MLLLQQSLLFYQANLLQLAHGRSSGSFPPHHLPCIMYTNDGVLSENIYVCKKILSVFENNRKSLIQHYEQSELSLHFECYQTGPF